MVLLRGSVDAPAGFATFYRRHAEDVLVFLSRRTLDPEAALDLTAETFAQAFISRGRFRGTSDPEVFAWLYAIARHQLAHYLRKGHAEKRALRRLGIAEPTASVDDLARIERLASLPALRSLLEPELQRLPAEQRAAIQLRVVEERSYSEVARQLQIAEQAARARVSRGLRSLAKALEAAEQSLTEVTG